MKVMIVILAIVLGIQGISANANSASSNSAASSSGSSASASASASASSSGSQKILPVASLSSNSGSSSSDSNGAPAQQSTLPAAASALQAQPPAPVQTPTGGLQQVNNAYPSPAPGPSVSDDKMGLGQQLEAIERLPLEEKVRLIRLLLDKIPAVSPNLSTTIQPETTTREPEPSRTVTISTATSATIVPSSTIATTRAYPTSKFSRNPGLSTKNSTSSPTASMTTMKTSKTSSPTPVTTTTHELEQNKTTTPLSKIESPTIDPFTLLNNETAPDLLDGETQSNPAAFSPNETVTDELIRASFMPSSLAFEHILETTTFEPVITTTDSIATTTKEKPNLQHHLSHVEVLPPEQKFQLIRMMLDRMSGK